MSDRELVFISKATPEDDEFVLWLAPKLEAAGYIVFADILSLKAGDRWRKEVTSALQENAIKMLLCCRDSSLRKNGVQEEIGIGEDLSKELNDKRFIIPLRLEKFKKVFGIGEIQYVDFLGGWANGLKRLLEELEGQGIPKNNNTASISPNWEIYKQRLSISIQNEEELLTTNWARIPDLPNAINFYKCKGAVDIDLLKQACACSEYPAEVYLDGIFSFMSLDEVSKQMIGVGSFEKKFSYSTDAFIHEGINRPNIQARDARNLIISMLRQSWHLLCRRMELTEYNYSNQVGFHVNTKIVPIGKKVPWGQADNRRNSMLRNIARGKVWEYGVSAIPFLWPFPHFKLKSRILFSELSSGEAGSVIDDAQKQHKLRRSVCSGWRNKAWHGRLMAFMKILANDRGDIQLPLSPEFRIFVPASPVVVTSPVTTKLQNNLSEDEDEIDPTTLGNFDQDGET